MTEENETPDVPEVTHQTMADVDPSMHRFTPEPSTAPAVAETGPVTSLGEEESTGDDDESDDYTT